MLLPLNQLTKGRADASSWPAETNHRQSHDEENSRCGFGNHDHEVVNVGAGRRIRANTEYADAYELLLKFEIVSQDMLFPDIEHRCEDQMLRE